ncbi:MAG: hypothetical protein NTZ79_10245 [Proteobacteria bacterium]|nr:hypothetical protein [Pseudomonadota bacterium]
MSREQPSHSLSIRDNRLYIEDVETGSIAERFGTPLFVVSEAHLRHNFRQFRDSYCSVWPEGCVRILPSIKASPLIAIQRILTTEGAGCDIFGASELEAAVRAGVPPALMSVNGSQKDRITIRRAIELGARVVLDSVGELDICESEARKLSRRARVMFRLKPFLDGLEVMSDYAPDHRIRDLIQIIKYGLPTSDLPSMGARSIQSPYIDPVGVHVHMGRHSKRLDVWRAWVSGAVALTKELSGYMNGWVPREFNLGGGFASAPDFDTDVAIKGYAGPTLDELAEAITSTLRDALSLHGFSSTGMQLEIEPGRAIHCDTGIHLTTVRNIKRETRNIQRTWAEVDTSQMFLGIGGANFHSPKFEFLPATRASAPRTSKMDIVGVTCNLELLFHQVAVPALEPGDVIALLNTGSYIETCAQNFNALPRPGTVLVNGDHAELIKRGEVVQDVFARDIVPSRLTESSYSTQSGANALVGARQ